MNNTEFWDRIVKCIAAIVLGLLVILFAVVWKLAVGDKVLCGHEQMRRGDTCVATSGGEQTRTSTYTEEETNTQQAPWAIGGIGVLLVGGGLLYSLDAYQARRPVEEV